MNFHQEFWFLISLAIKTYFSWKSRRKRKKKTKKTSKAFKFSVIRPIHLIPIRFFHGFLLFFMLFGPGANFKNSFSRDKSHIFQLSFHLFNEESDLDDSPLLLSSTDKILQKSMQSPIRCKIAKFDIMMQSSDCYQILTIAGPSIVMDYSNLTFHGKSILEFSVPFASTVLTKT